MSLYREQGQKSHLPAVGLRGPHQFQHGPTVRLGGDLPGRAGGLQLGWIFGKFASCCQVCMVGFGRKTKPGLVTGMPMLQLVPLLVPELRSRWENSLSSATCLQRQGCPFHWVQMLKY